MRHILVAMGMLLSSTAFAQQRGDERWVAKEAASERFAAGRTPGPTFREGQRVVVLAVEGGKVRVFAGRKFGWLPPGVLPDEDPSGTPVVPLTPGP